MQFAIWYISKIDCDGSGPRYIRLCLVVLWYLIKPRFLQGEIWLIVRWLIIDHASLVKTSPIYIHVMLC